MKICKHFYLFKYAQTKPQFEEADKIKNLAQQNSEIKIQYFVSGIVGVDCTTLSYYKIFPTNMIMQCLLAQQYDNAVEMQQ